MNPSVVSVDHRPSPWVMRFGARLPAGSSVLDLACGGGRHALWFAARGCRVTAVDRELNPAWATHDCVRYVSADLEGDDWPLSGQRFTTVIVTNYLFRPRLSDICALVADGGWLIYETFAAGNEAFGRPKNPHFLLQPGELLSAVDGQFHVVAYEHGTEHTPSPVVRQRIAAFRGRAPVLI